LTDSKFHQQNDQATTSQKQNIQQQSQKLEESKHADIIPGLAVAQGVTESKTFRRESGDFVLFVKN